MSTPDQESAKLKHMLLIAETQNEQYRKQLEESKVHDFEAVSAEKEKYEALVKRMSQEIEELKVTKLELDESVTKSKYQIENAQSENRRLRDEHNELTIERRRLVEERAALGADFEQKLRQVDDLERTLRAVQDERDTINEQAEEQDRLSA